MLKLFTRAGRKLSLFVLLSVFISATLVALTPPKQVQADNPKPTLPLTWVDAAHSRAVSANNIPFRPLGYLCVDGSKWFHNSGKNIEIASEAQPQDDEDDIFVQSWMEGMNPRVHTSELIKGEWCVKSSKDNMPSFAWVTSFASGTNYALIILPCYGSSDKNANKPVDPKDVMVAKDITAQTKGTCIFLSPIGGDGKAGIDKILGKVDEIKIDPTKQGGAGVGLDAPEDVCPIKFWKLSWLVCPVATILYGEDGNGGVLGMLQEWIVSHLALNVEEIFGSKQYYAAWNSFRIIAVSLIIVAGLIMVISQAAGLEFMNAYTIRTLLPRLLVVAIIISLSWWMLEYIVQFFNNLMIWVGSAIEAPFGNKIDQFGAVSMMTQITAVIVAGTLVNPMMIMSYLMVIAVAYAVAVLALAVRELILIFIILTSPIFLFFAIFNGTEKYFKTARSSFIGLLAVGVAFVGLLELGHVMAELTPADSDPFGVIRLGFQVAALLAFPVILVRLGGATAAITTAFRGRTQGFFANQTKMRSEQRAGIIASMKTGSRYSGRNAMTRTFNRATKGFANSAPTSLRSMGNYGNIRRARLDASTRRGAEEIMKNPAFAPISQDDNVLRVAARSNNTGEAVRGMTDHFYGSEREKLENDVANGALTAGQADTQARAAAASKAKDAVSQLQASGLKIGTQDLQVAAAMQLVNTGTGYSTQREMVDTFAVAAHGNVNLGAAVAGWADSAAQMAGRSDLAPSAGTLIDMTVRTIQGNAPSENEYLDAGVHAMMRADNYSATARMKSGGMKNGMQNLAAGIQRAENTIRSSSNAAAVDAAKLELGQLKKKMENLKSSAGIYAPESNVLTINEGARQVRDTLDNVQHQVTPTTTVYDATARIPQLDNAGNPVIDPATGGPAMVDNPNYQQPIRMPNGDFDARIAEGYSEAGGTIPNGNAGGQRRRRPRP